jgi:hypothetical protein
MYKGWAYSALAPRPIVAREPYRDDYHNGQTVHSVIWRAGLHFAISYETIIRKWLAGADICKGLTNLNYLKGTGSPYKANPFFQKSVRPEEG